MTDAKPVAELRREAHRACHEGGQHSLCSKALLHLLIDTLADRAEAAESDLQRTTQLWKRALADWKAAESRIANEIAARQRAQKHGIGDRARIEELERELAEVGVRGSPPPGGSYIQHLLADKVKAERERDATLSEFAAFSSNASIALNKVEKERDEALERVAFLESELNESQHEHAGECKTCASGIERRRR